MCGVAPCGEMSCGETSSPAPTRSWPKHALVNIFRNFLSTPKIGTENFGNFSLIKIGKIKVNFKIKHLKVESDKSKPPFG